MAACVVFLFTESFLPETSLSMRSVTIFVRPFLTPLSGRDFSLQLIEHIFGHLQAFTTCVCLDWELQGGRTLSYISAYFHVLDTHYTGQTGAQRVCREKGRGVTVLVECMWYFPIN